MLKLTKAGEELKPLLACSMCDYGCDSLSEDGELPDDVIEAIDKFNKVIKETKPVSWSPGNKAVLLK